MTRPARFPFKLQIEHSQFSGRSGRRSASGTLQADCLSPQRVIFGPGAVAAGGLKGEDRTADNCMAFKRSGIPLAISSPITQADIGKKFGINHDVYNGISGCNPISSFLAGKKAGGTMKLAVSARRTLMVFSMVFLTAAFLCTSSGYAQTQPAQAPAAGQPAPEQKPAEAKPKAVGNNLGLPAKLGEEIAKAPEGKGKGLIDVNEPRGVFGIPGAPQFNWILALVWATWVGWIFSTVGAFGGIMAGVGHMTVYGLGDYADSFKKTAPNLGKTLTDSLRTSNQFLVGLSAILSVINYLKARRMSWPLGLALGAGAIIGGSLVPWLTGGKVGFKEYQGYFGLFVLIVGIVLFYETTPKGQAGKKRAKEAAQAFEKSVKEKKEDTITGISVSKWGITQTTMSFFGLEFSFNPIWAFLGGIVIAAISSFIGVGGGFLYVPYLTSVVGLPMFVVAGTSALAVFISMVTSITGYIKVAGAGMDWALIGIQLVGVFIGSMIGPRTAKYIPDIWLKRIFIVLALYVGLGYSLKGFLNTQLPGI